MDKRLLLLLLLLVTCSLGVLIIREDENIDIVFTYGVKANRANPVNKLDTINDLFTKDMIRDPSITFEMKLSPSEIKQITEKMEEIDFFTYPGLYYPESSDGSVTPYMTYDLKVYEDGKLIKQVRMDTDAVSDDVKTSELLSLFHLIMNIIESTDEWQNSPEPTSGYA
ncbi:MAG: hypothetical protein NWF07_12110 [Candidatus Bathyarchaeota archaeon]|nr:hypothetical protein [Candidatus Bathyarchaeota archaeon]